MDPYRWSLGALITLECLFKLNGIAGGVVAKEHFKSILKQEGLDKSMRFLELKVAMDKISMKSMGCGGPTMAISP